MTLIEVVVALASLGAVGVSIAALLHTRHKDDAEVKVEQSVNKFDELERMNGILRSGLSDAQVKADQLRLDLAAVQSDIDRLNYSLTVALANVALLNDFIEANVPPERGRPKLRRMPA